MSSILSGGWLSGKKTHLLAGLAVISALVGYLTGTVDLTMLIEAVVASGLFSSLRLGISKAEKAAKTDGT